LQTYLSDLLHVFILLHRQQVQLNYYLILPFCFFERTVSWSKKRSRSVYRQTGLDCGTWVAARNTRKNKRRPVTGSTGAQVDLVFSGFKEVFQGLE
jgi:hypothetical protein